MIKNYNKLIRDRIPEIIAADGKQFATAVLEEEQFRRALAEKLVEEAVEAREAVFAGGQEEIIKELADVFEVLEALLDACGMETAVVRKRQVERRAARGGFEERLALLWVEE